jgi:hypothetical protein
MTKEQIFEVLQLIGQVYPSFEVTQEKIDVWHRLLKDQNPAVVMRNAEQHVLGNKFPPTIADLREVYHPAYNSKILEQVAQWEREATKNEK